MTGCLTTGAPSSPTTDSSKTAHLFLDPEADTTCNLGSTSIAAAISEDIGPSFEKFDRADALFLALIRVSSIRMSHFGLILKTMYF